MVDDSYVSMVSEIGYAMMIYGAFGELTFFYLLLANIVTKFTASWNISPIYRGWLRSLGIARELFF